MSSDATPHRSASARLVRYARRKEHLTQRGLADRSGVPQETIARIEGGKVSPRFETLAHLLDACGFELGIARRKGDGVDRSQIRELLRYDSSERAVAAAAGNENVRELVDSARRTMTTSQPSFDPLGLLSALGNAGVRFVVIGGFAAQLHGSPSLTVDLDICPAPERDNLDRLAAVLIDLEARLRDSPEGLPFRIDGRTLAAGDWFTFQTRLGMLDVLQRPTGDLGHTGLAATAAAFQIGGRRVHVAALDDIIAMKTAAGRPKDRIEIEVLGALRDELDRQGPT